MSPSPALSGRVVRVVLHSSWRAGCLRFAFQSSLDQQLGMGGRTMCGCHLGRTSYPAHSGPLLSRLHKWVITVHRAERIMGWNSPTRAKDREQRLLDGEQLRVTIRPVPGFKQSCLGHLGVKAWVSGSVLNTQGLVLLLFPKQ